MLTGCAKIAKTVLSVLGWGITGALTGGAAGALVGALHGLLAGSIHGDPWRFVSTAISSAVAGSVAGGLVASVSRMIDAEGVADLAGHSPQSGEARDSELRETSAFANPLIARWRFLDRSALEDNARMTRRFPKPSLN